MRRMIYSVAILVAVCATGNAQDKAKDPATRASNGPGSAHKIDSMHRHSGSKNGSQNLTDKKHPANNKPSSGYMNGDQTERSTGNETKTAGETQPNNTVKSNPSADPKAKINEPASGNNASGKDAGPSGASPKGGSASQGNAQDNGAGAGNTSSVPEVNTSGAGSPAMSENGSDRDGTNNAQRAKPNMAGSPAPGKMNNARKSNEGHHEKADAKDDSNTNSAPEKPNKKKNKLHSLLVPKHKPDSKAISRLYSYTNSYR